MQDAWHHAAATPASEHVTVSGAVDPARLHGGGRPCHTGLSDRGLPVPSGLVEVRQNRLRRAGWEGQITPVDAESRPKRVGRCGDVNKVGLKGGGGLGNTSKRPRCPSDAGVESTGWQTYPRQYFSADEKTVAFVSEEPWVQVPASTRLERHGPVRPPALP